MFPQKARGEARELRAQLVAPARLEEPLERRAQQERDAERHKEEDGEHHIEACA